MVTAAEDFAALDPDPVMARAHLEYLFRRCPAEYPGGRCEIAWTAAANSWAVNAAENFATDPAGLDKATATAVMRNREGRNVYVGVNPRIPGRMPVGRASAQDVEICFFQFVECDKPESLGRLQHPPIPFSLAVITGTVPNKRLHCYYELTEPVRDMAQWRARQEALRDYFGGDAVVDPPRIMRLAGTVNHPAPHKAARGYKAELVTFHGTRRATVSNEAFDKAYDAGAATADAAEQEAPRSDQSRFGDEQDRIDQWLDKIVAGDHWHDNARDLVAHLVSRGYDRRIILALAPRLTLKGYAVTQTSAELDEFIRGAEAKFACSGDDSAEDDIDFDAPPPLWHDTRLSEWATREIPPRIWVMEDWIPAGQCIGLYGRPGLQKTDLLLQLLMAASAGLTFCGIPLMHVPTYGLFCEDTDEEIGRRGQRIAGFYGRSLSEFTGFRYASLVGLPSTEFVAFDRSGEMRVRPAFELFRQRVTEHSAGLAALDTAPDFFGGDEIRRRQVAQFLRLLDGAAMRLACAIVFSAHPSKNGISTGALDSGSTGWEGKVRARLTLRDPETDENDDRTCSELSDKRVLTRVKCNYARQGEELQLIFRNGGFAVEGLGIGGTKRGTMRDLAANAKFLDLLEKVRRSGSYVNDGPTHPERYAPTVFAKRPDHGDFSKAEFERAMRRLLADEKIRLVDAGVGRSQHKEFVHV
jgi:RecA-family ATPase